MACTSVAFLLVGSLGAASATLTEHGDRADLCIADCPSGIPSRGSVLLQTQRGATERLQPDVPELPPPFTSEMGSAESSSEDARGPSLLQRMSPSAAELEHFQLLKDLRKRGHQCPGGKSFAAIPDTESTFLFDCRLWEAARFWSSEMGNGNFFSHTQGGSDPCSRTASYGLTTCSENIAAGSGDPAAALKQWMESDGHCVNMMDPQNNRFGVGYVEVAGSQWTHYWTQSLGTDRAAADQSCLANVPSPEVSVATTTATTKLSGPCEDKDAACPIHYGQYCDTEHIKTTCPLTCGQCTSPGVSATTTTMATTRSPTFDGPCEDQDPYCPTHYEQYCNTEHTQNTCPLTCGQCTLSAASPTSPPLSTSQAGRRRPYQRR